MCGTMVNCCKKEGCLYELDKDMDRSVRDHHPVGTGYRILGSDNSCFADRDLDECCILGHATEKTGLSQTGATSLCQERIRQNKKTGCQPVFCVSTNSLLRSLFYSGYTRRSGVICSSTSSRYFPARYFAIFRFISR